MIKFQDFTPDVYYRESRDFQYFGRLYDLLLNYVKTNTELIYRFPVSDNVDTELIDLIITSLGFKSKHNYSTEQLNTLCKSFAKILRNKGNIQSIEQAGNALLAAEGVSAAFRVNYDEDNKILYLFLPPELSDTTLFNDVLNYILPAGLACRIYRASSESADFNETYVVNNKNTKVYKDNGEKTTKYAVPTSTEVEDNLNNLTVIGNNAGFNMNTIVYAPESANSDDNKNIKD